jgi:endoglucanase Acf2
MYNVIKKSCVIVMSIAMIAGICPQGQIFYSNVVADTISEEPYNLSYGRPVYASSQNGNDAAEYAVDGLDNTRWQAGNTDENEWLYVDLGKEADIDHVYIHWEAAYAKAYEIQFSNDEENWDTVYTKGRVTKPEQAVGLKISYEIKSVDDGYATIQASWDFVDNASYKVCIDKEDNVAVAPDGYKFTSHGPNQGQIKLPVGNHKIMVYAIDKTTGQVTGTGTLEGEFTEDVTTKAETTAVETNQYEDTITFENLSDAQKKARYVRILVNERAIAAYGCSMYEFQVYGDNGARKRPVDYGTNLALKKAVTCSGIRDEWWMKDEEGNITENAYNNVKPENAVDGNTGTSFTSYQGDDQWIYVDLGQAYTIGRIVINWNADAGKIYDVLVSSDAQNWTTVHRVQKGFAYKQDNFTLYQQNVRYVKVLGYTKVESGSGIGIYELSVYEYKEGDSKKNETLSQLPQQEILKSATGKGTYVTGQMYNEKNKLPTFINEENISTPIDSNSWWSSAMVQKYSNLLCSTPLKASFSIKGLGVLLATSGWVGTRTENDLGTDQSTESGIDFYIIPEKFDTETGYDRVENYGDYSVTLGLVDGTAVQMKSTIVKGSPYIFNEFCDNTVVFISGQSIETFYDGSGNQILKNKGDTITTDHIAFKSMDDENTKAGNNGSYFEVNVPKGTTFKVMIGKSNYKIKVTFPSVSENYMSVAAMTDLKNINSYYQHGYAFVTDTQVDYTYNHDNSKIITTYTATTEVKRAGFANVTMHGLFPHQWKHSTAANSPVATYTSIRGNIKSIWTNTYKTTQQFSGLLPTFAKANSDMMDTEEMIDYLNQVVASKVDAAPVSDAYWEGKNVHPLAISAIMADQLGETEIKEKLLAKLKSIMVDWFNYDGADDRCYLIYNKDWGTVYYPDSAYGANAAICDHHFTYGYFMFGAAVLATYDKAFLNDYREMIELLVRDYADPMEPEEDGNMFCKFRTFDQYSGHSWAGGYGDSDSGNNQESASEALFSWVGMYLWGEVTQNDTYLDAGAYGFTTEMDAVEQYWFDYDEDNWLPDYPFEATGQIYGASMGYGTYFGGQPVYIYGIQWLPISEYLTNYGMNQEKCAKIYQGLEDDTAYAIAIEKRLGNITEDDEYATPDNGWQHITWPYLSQTDPQRAYDKFKANVSKVQVEDRANTLWFISAMDAIGYRTNDYMVVGNIQGSVYVKDGVYTAEVWNPTEITQTVTIKKADGTKVGTASVGSKATVAFKIDTEKTFDISQVSTPTIKATAIADGTVKKNVTGIATFNDTQFIELSSEDDADIYYTTDGTVPTTSSDKYNGKILISSNTTVKAIAVKSGNIDSAYASAVIKIDGDTVQSNTNLAVGKTATASSEDGAATADLAIDGNSTTRWQAQSADDEYLQVDLGSIQMVNTVTITWEAAYAEKYEIQVSEDGEKWKTVATEIGNKGEVTSTFAAVKAQYVRMQGIKRATQYGYSVYEIEIYGALQADAPVISPISGVYSGIQTITMSTSVKGAEVKYTLDGSIPTENSATYVEPIKVNKSVIVKAVTYRKGMILSDVTESDIVIEGTIAINPSSVKIAIDGEVQLSALSNEAVTWKSDNTSIVTVDNNGLITGKKPGTATVTAETSSGKREVCIVTVTEPVHITSIDIPETYTIKNKISETLELKIYPEDTTDDKTATWKSSDEHVVAVSNAGTLTAKGEGEADVTVTVGNHTAVCHVTVAPAATNEEMVSNAKYNVALNQNFEIYPGAEGNKNCITDGKLTAGGAHCALSTGWGYTEESYVIIDLGEKYDASTIDRILVQYKDKNDNDTVVGKTYNIEYSTDGETYTTIYESGKISAEDMDSDNCIATDVSGNSGAVRYVKVYYPTTATYGIQICEVAVLGTEKNAKLYEEAVIDEDIEILGYQISNKAFDGEGGIRVIATVEPTINNKNVKEWGFVYGIANVNGADTGITESEMTVNYDSNMIVSYRSTSEGTLSENLGGSKTSTNYVRTMSFGNTNVVALTAKYKVRAYALLEDGSYVYSTISEYSIYQVADYIYRHKLMNSQGGYDFLYDRILTVVNKEYEKLDFEWSELVTTVSK